MLKRSRKIHLSSLIIGSVIIAVVLILGLLQYRSTKSWSTKANDSNTLRRELAELMKEFQSLEKTIRSPHIEDYSVELDNFIQSKSRIQKQMSDLIFYIGKTDVAKSDLDSALVLGNIYFSTYQNILVQKLQSQDSEDWQGGTFDLSDLELTAFLTEIQQKERESIANQFNESQEWIIYFYTSTGLMAFLLLIGIVFHRVINKEFNTCDDAVLRDKIYQEIFEHTEKIAGLGHGFFNFNEKKIVFSTHLYKILGLKPTTKTPTFRDYLRQVHPDDRIIVIDTLKSLSLTNDRVETHCRIITPSGKLKYVEVLAIFKIEKQERMVIFVNRDVTIERASELQMLELNQNLTLQNRMFKHVEKIASIGFFSFGLDSGSVIFSDNLFRMLGFEPNSFKVSKKMLLSFVLEEHVSLVSNWLDPEMPSEELVNLPVKFKTFYGQIIFVSLSREFFGEKEKVLLVTLKDVTQEGLTNQQLELQNQELNRSNAELASFNHIASHDLQEPLRKIQTFISLLHSLNDFKLTDQAKDYLFRIQRSSNRMQLLIRDLLQFSRVSKVDKIFKVEDLNSILLNTLEELVLLIEEKKAEIEVSNLPQAEVIPHQIQQLFLNLIENALKFSRADVPNRIVISLEKLTNEELALFPAYKEDGLIKISISDHGIGFDPIHAESIFVIFKRLHNKFDFPGSGVGLAICQKIINNHHGKIFAGSQGKGAKFTFIIPKYQRVMANSG
ncbi:ATP-binding protein [Aquiflexum sp. TKW24L]|uniref:sensor histidine kinase n=1 Tax=Aquiflexum sp. TKW24L TaxID=2942212 RepID=UPI0020BE1826|nr:PAS domain-containing sensor histidine kinase [Aquiflexum sp. TKW24L]MCL6261563.1 ATP-binding protein [Aquiflexum sp. TKW24L]